MLTNAQQTVKASLGTTFGDMLHEGRYYDRADGSPGYLVLDGDGPVTFEIGRAHV